MVSQFNLPHLFVTISAAELKWNELIVILKLVLDKTSITEEESEKMSKHEKEGLIQRDPVTCARYFEHRASAIFKTWKNSHGPFGNRLIKHSYHRIEFQHRGSPHVHMILWLDGAPTYDASNSSKIQEVCNFIDEVITCSSDWPEDDPIHQLLYLQTHRHSHTCKKRSHKGVNCRFGIPFFPMDETNILHPFDEQPQEIKNFEQDYKKIRNYLETAENPLPSDMTFSGFLQEISLTRDRYILAIRSSLKKSKIYIKRRPCEIYINPYNDKILRLQKSNMDIQFILDAYACCCYIIDYINKSDRGTSDLLRKVSEDVQNGNKSLAQRLQALGAAHHMNSELSAQEAAYNVLQIPMSRCTESCIFIPTGPPDQRTRMMKSNIDLQQLNDDSEDVFVDGLLQRYISRPDILSYLNLAQFAAWYDFALKRPGSWTPPINDDTVESEEAETTEKFCKYLALKNGKPGYLWKRTYPKIIRYVRYNKNKDRHNFFREQVMLYLPWRDEQTEIINQDCEKIVTDNIESISTNRSEFNAFQDNILDVAMESALNEDRQSDADENIHIPEEIQEEFQLVDPIPGNNIDFGGDVIRPFSEKFTLPNRILDKEFEELFSSLNMQQRDFITHILDHFKRSPDIPIYTYLKGGAGVGKSHVIRTLYQALIRVFNSNVNSNPDKPSVLLTAPTGLAAFNIFGLTIHNAFQLPVNQKEATKLSDSVSNTMATLYSELRVLIIDEISMVGQHILEMIDRRLRDLCDGSKPFGGISVIAVGDFRQLPPVLATSLMAGTMSNSISALFSKPLWHMFSVHELTIIMRQRDDAAFALALNNMASGTMTDDDLQLFKLREFSTVPIEVIAQRPIHLFYTNEAVDAYNRLALSTLPGVQAISTAKDSLSGGTSEASKVALLNWVASAPLSKTQGLHTSLLLKEGGRYIMTINVDTSDGLVNGVGCILKRIDFGISNLDASVRKPLRLWVKFENSRSGQKIRSRNIELIRQLQIDSEWTPISPCTVVIQPRSNATTKITRSQFPLNAAEAQTIHKAQGSTYELVVVHFTPGIKRDLLYVACSRATKASGLFLIGIIKKTKTPKETDPISIEFKRHQEMKLIPVYEQLRIRDDYNRQIQIVFHNVQSLHAHYGLYKSDDVYKNSNIILMAETWTLTSDDFTIDGHLLATSVDSDNVRRAIGTRIYCCPLVQEHITDSNSEIEHDRRGSCSISSVTFGNIRVIAVYKSPGCNSSVMISLIKKQMCRSYVSRTLVAGDFNEDFNKASSNSPQHALEELGLQIRSPPIPTTRNGTQIDAMFSNFDLFSAGVYTSISSHHEPLWARINLN